MNAKKFQMILIAVLIALLANTALVFAYPAEPPDHTPARVAVTSGSCAAILSQAEKVTAQVDIPSRRAEYTRLANLGRCQLLAGTSITIPVTGPTRDLGRERYEYFKLRQAEMMGH